MRAFIWERRFWSKTRTVGDCEIWLGARGNGYGDTVRNGHHESAHRVAWRLTYGPIPAGKLILHHCDVRLCIKPEHLYAGTSLDNSRDAVERGQQPRGERHGRRTKPEAFIGRARRGERHGMAKLTYQQVEFIRDDINRGMRQSDLARIYRVSQSTISLIANGRTWSLSGT